MNNVITLGNITSLSLCVSFRSRIETDNKFDTKLIKMQDIDDYIITTNDLDKIEYTGTIDQYLHNGDLIIKTRPPKIFASMVQCDNDEKLISVAPMIRARIIDPQKIPPYYLIWYFTSEFAQRYFNQQIQGTALLSLPISVFKDLPVPILSLDEMNTIGEIFQKNIQYQSTINKLATIQQKKMDTVLNSIIGEYHDSSRN